jgi:NADH-quinone oxidoreductase subunit M
MKVMPFLAVCYVIGGLASLGLPGLSGFVAEMTIFVGGFQNPELFYKIVTVIATTAIVVTAVYILRVVGTLLFGPIKNPEFEKLGDAKWFERISTVTLIVAVAGIGIAPLWLSNIIQDSLTPIVNALMQIM